MVKGFYPYFALFLAFAYLGLSIDCAAQSEDQEQIVGVLMKKIESSEQGERLYWMDSLSTYIAYETNFEDDSVVRATRRLALDLDSFDMAIHHTANLLFYLNNIKGTPEEGKELYFDSEQYLPKVRNLNIKSKYYYDAGNSFYYLKEFEQALRLYDSVEVFATTTNYTDYIGFAKMGKGQVYTDKGDFGSASLILQEAVNYFRAIKDTTRLISARNSLAILYSKNNFFEEAQKERDEIIELSLRLNDYSNLFVLHYNAAADNRKTKDYVARIENMKKALDAAERSDFNDYYVPIALSGITLAYAEADSLEKAEQYLARIHSDLERNTTGPFRTYYLEAVKEVELLKKNYAKAIEYGEEYLSLMQEGKQYEEIEFGEFFLYRAYEAMGNYNRAFEHYKNYHGIRDSISQSQKVRVLSYYQTLYETEKRDLIIQAQESNIELLDQKNKVKRQWLMFGGFGALGLFGFAWMLRSRNFARRRQRLQAQFTQDILKTQESERARIASELHDSVGQKLLVIKNSLVSKASEDQNEIELVGETIKEVREMSHSLHPFQFEKLGLVKSLKNMIETLQKNSKIFYSEDIMIEDGLIDKEAEIYIFRMLQEAVTNVEKHSDANACNLSVEHLKNEVIFTLKDNGKGFDQNSVSSVNEGLGMKTLRERAQFIGAKLNIETAPKKGTKITIRIPIA